MQKRVVVFMLLAAAAATPAIVQNVRKAIGAKQLPQAEEQVKAERQQQGVTPEWLEANSWLGRGALAEKDYARAERYANETYDLSLAALKTRKLDDERALPIALGAAIEVRAHVMAARGERSQAIAYLQQEDDRWRATSIHTRIRKNINLLSLEGMRAPAYSTSLFAGSRPTSLAELKGRPVLMMLWAHWCGDCKRQAPVLGQIDREFGDRIALVGLTKHYGYVAGGVEAAPDAELRYIDEIRAKYYTASAPHLMVPVDDAAFQEYGASTTPTLVLIDRTGVVRLYRPGFMSYEELAVEIRKLLADVSS